MTKWRAPFQRHPSACGSIEKGEPSRKGEASEAFTPILDARSCAHPASAASRLSPPIKGEAGPCFESDCDVIVEDQNYPTGITIAKLTHPALQGGTSRVTCPVICAR